MERRSYPIGRLKRSQEDNALRCAIGARLDRALHRAGMRSAKAAKRLSVSENDVQYWRRGITVPPLHAFTCMAAILVVDVHWLCTGQVQIAHAAAV
jgi:ribosome-binding protein aMBF1 (putative translation factor)